VHDQKETNMAVDDSPELEQRVRDLHDIRNLLAKGNDVPIVYPWAFLVWAVLVGSGTIVHYVLFTRTGMATRSALAWIWLPVLVLGALAEGVSFAIRAGRESLPLFNKRLGNAILSAFALLVALAFVAVRLALTALTPGLAIMLCAMPLVFYAQISYSSLFFETFGGIAVGLVFEFAGENGPVPFLVAGIFITLLYAGAGIHAWLVERRARG
jgi:hypothetical protein